jgi:hypothetical protein
MTRPGTHDRVTPWQPPNSGRSLSSALSRGCRSARSLRFGMNSGGTRRGLRGREGTCRSADSRRAASTRALPLSCIEQTPARALRSLPGWTRRESAPSPKEGVRPVGTMRKLATQKTSFRSAAVITTLGTAHLSCAVSKAGCRRRPGAAGPPRGVAAIAPGQSVASRSQRKSSQWPDPPLRFVQARAALCLGPGR